MIVCRLDALGQLFGGGGIGQALLSLILGNPTLLGEIDQSDSLGQITETLRRRRAHQLLIFGVAQGLRLFEHRILIGEELIAQRIENILAAAAGQQGCRDIDRVAHEIAQLVAHLAAIDDLPDFLRCFGRKIAAMAAGVARIFDQLHLRLGIAHDEIAIGGLGDRV